MQYGRKIMVMVVFFCAAALIGIGCTMKRTPEKDLDVAMTHAGNKFHRFEIGAYEPLSAAGYVKAVENFTILFDPSASMTEVYSSSYECVACHTDYQDPGFAESHAVKYGGKEFEGKEGAYYSTGCNRCHQDSNYTKFNFAKDLAKGLNQCIPELDYKGLIRTFGSPGYMNLHYGLEERDNTKIKIYDKQEYGRAFDKIFEADGVSPLADALMHTGKDWFEKKGRIAVIVISDGVDMDEREVLAAEDLKRRYGDRICIYTILIGNDPYGRSVMNRVAETSVCGVAVNADLLLKKKDMEKFVKKIFLARGPDGEDKDRDGVPDYCDHCPSSAADRKVDENGCWDLVLSADVLFDFDKYTLKPEGVLALEQVKNMLTKNPFLDLHISGHTDNYGSMAYNIGLSRRRAKTGYDYLVNQGINPDRLSMSWHSYTMPVAGNDTAQGRALNRRLEFKFKKRMTE